MANVRPSPLAGRWYPADASRLTQIIDDYLGEPQPTPDHLYGLLAPHAGLVYSGPVAGRAFRYTIGLKVDTVVIVAPSHHVFPADLLSTAHTHFETPLGQVTIAHDLLHTMMQRIELLQVTKDPEHAVEIELPFLQRTLGAFELLPLVMLDQSWATARLLGETLAEILTGRQALLVASSDLSHFYPQQQANIFDQVILDAVAAYDPAGVIQAEHEARGFACGRGAIAAVMVAAQRLGASQASVVSYATSGDATGDMTRVVGYGAALFN
ncbi:MAG: AmmeMemoRadiSam system protein B [Anaerolineales bacterium]|nr:AmmeMemoRadiSam system protein B [Anaerolineales bacterium]